MRLACIRHAASVRPEPGSNSSLCGWSGSLRCNEAQHTELDGSRVHHHDSVVKVRLPITRHSGEQKTRGPARGKARRAPGDVSGTTASAFRERDEPEERVVTSTRDG